MKRWLEISVLALLVGLPVGNAGAAITVDGTINPADEWTATSPGSVADINEAAITDDTVDLSAVSISNGDDTLSLYFRWDVYQAPPPYEMVGGLVEYGFELYLPGSVTLYATNNPFMGGTPDGTTFFLEDDFQTASNTGTYAVGAAASTVVEASVPYGAFGDLGIAIPPAGLDVEYLGYLVDQTAQPDDDTATGSFTIIVPEPATVTLVTLAIGGMAGYARRRRRRWQPTEDGNR